MKTRITICGGGNAAHTLAGLLSSKPELFVNIYAPFCDEAVRWQQGIQDNGGITVHTLKGDIHGRPAVVTRDPALAMQGTELILLALPAFAHEAVLRQISPHIPPGAWVGAIPARAGFDLCLHNVLREQVKEISFFGFQTLPWACRIKEFGKQAVVLGTKEQVDMTAFPGSMAPMIADCLGDLLGLHLHPTANFLSLALADAGQIIHPGIMFGLFHDWNGEPFDRQGFFYQAVDDAIAEILQQMSDEIQSICSELKRMYPGLDLSTVRQIDEWLKFSYQSNISNSKTLQSCFASNTSYAGLLAPMKKIEEGYIPDFQARYLSEDVPYNLLVTRGITELAGVSTPVIDRVLYWAQEKLGREYLVSGKMQGADLQFTRSPQRYGYRNLDQLLQVMQYLPTE